MEKVVPSRAGGAARRLEGVTSGDLVKRHFLEKASLNTRENVIPATWRKRGPLGKGNY